MDIPARIRAMAATLPAKPALTDGETRLDAAAMALGMDQVAAALVARGLRPGDVIGTIAGLSADHLMIHLGAMALGATIVPLQPTAHPDALSLMLQNCAPRLLLTDADCQVRTGADQARIADLMREAAALPPRPATPIPPETLVDILYSSGTTGTPKGIAH